MNRPNLILTFLITIYCISSCNVNHSPIDVYKNKTMENSGDSLITNERLKLRKYAFCKCLMYKYTEDSLLINDGSIEGFLEMGSYGNHAYELIDSFVWKKSQVPIESKYKKKLFIMKCLEIYESPALDSLIKRLDNESSVPNSRTSTRW